MEADSKDLNTCRYCDNAVYPKDSKIAIGKLIDCGLSYDQATSEIPICYSCLDARHVLKSRGKYHENEDINTVCLWIKSRNIEANKVAIVEKPMFFQVSVGRRFQRFLKGAAPIKRGVLFKRLDSFIKS